MKVEERPVALKKHEIPASEDTLPKVLRRNAAKYPQQPALRKKRYGLWNTFTWREYYENVKYLALGMMSLGMQRGECVAIIGDNDPEWWYAALATAAAGGIEYGVFVDCGAPEVKYFVESSDATFVFARDQEQVDKLLEVKDTIPRVRKVIYWEKKGMWACDDPWVLELCQVQDIGREYEKTHPNAFDESVDAGKGEDTYCLCYTSGTTGDPKAVMINHRTMMLRCKDSAQFYPWRVGDDYFSSISPAWVLDQIFGICMALLEVAVVNFPESPQTTRSDAREIAAKFAVYGARMWEEMSRDIRVRLADADLLKRGLYNLFLPVGMRVADLIYENKKPGLLLKSLNKLGDLLVFRPLRDRLGFTYPNACFVAGSMLSPDLFRYFRAIGIPLATSYSSTEVFNISTERPGAMKLGSTGKLIPSREVKLTEDGELLVKVDDLTFSGYYKQPDATAEVIKDGWYHTGDAVYIDDDGYLFFLDRVKELMALSSGAKFSATYIESKLRFSPYIRDVMVLGDGREFVSALVNIDLGNVGKWAEKRHLVYTTFVDLSQRSEVLDLIESEIRWVNRALPEHARIRRFVNVHKEFDPDEAELTRTRKLKRGVLEVKYGELMNAIYDGSASVDVTTEVKYRDGRTAVIGTRLSVRDVRNA